MKPSNIKTKIFLDSGDPSETRIALDTLGFLDGQTTNPSLVAKNPSIQKKLANNIKLSRIDVRKMYKEIIMEISSIIPDGDISVEVYSDKRTLASQMIDEASEISTWSKDLRIKLPITVEGLKAAEELCNTNRLNMTLCFNQEQALAVYNATKFSKYAVFISPFIGRLNDIGINGNDLIKNIIEMYLKSDKHVEVLSASVRDLSGFLKCLEMKSDIITAPLNVLLEWSVNNSNRLKEIQYKNLDLSTNWNTINIQDELTDAGLDKFAKDFNALIAI